MRWSREDEILYEDSKNIYHIEFLNKDRGIVRTDECHLKLLLDALKTAHSTFINYPRDGSLDSIMPSMRIFSCRIKRKNKDGFVTIIECDEEMLEDKIQILLDEKENDELGYNSSPMLGEKHNDLRGFGRGKK